MMPGPKPPKVGETVLINGDRVTAISRGVDKFGAQVGPLYRVGPPGLSVLESTSWEAIRLLRWGWITTSVGASAMAAELHARRLERQVYDPCAEGAPMAVTCTGVGTASLKLTPEEYGAFDGPRVAPTRSSKAIPRGCATRCWSAVLAVGGTLRHVRSWAIVERWNVSVRLDDGQRVTLRPDGIVIEELDEETRDVALVVHRAAQFDDGDDGDDGDGDGDDGDARRMPAHQTEPPAAVQIGLFG